MANSTFDAMAQYCANLSTNQSLSIPTMSIDFKIFYTLSMLGIMIVGILGNALVIVVVICYSSMQTVANILLMSLSIADLVYLLCIPISVANINLENFVFGWAGCKAFMLSLGVNWFAGTYTLMAMSVDRFLAVVYPIESQPVRTTQVATVGIMVVWVLSFVLMLPVMLYSKYGEIPRCPPTNISSSVDAFPITTQSSLLASTAFPPEETAESIHWSCTIAWPGASSLNAFTWYTFFLVFFLPVICITILYSCVIIRLQTVGPENKSKERRDSIRRISRLVLAIVVVYVLFWLPYWIHQLLLTFMESLQRNIHLAVLLQMLGYANSAVNPVLYAFMSQNFRVMFGRLLCCCKKGKELNFVPSEISKATQGKPTKNAPYITNEHSLVNCEQRVSGTVKVELALQLHNATEKNGDVSDCLLHNEPNPPKNFDSMVTENQFYETEID